MLFRVLFYIYLLVFCISSLNSQNLNFRNESYTWPDFKKNFDAIPDSFKNDGAVILADDINLNFIERFLKRRQVVKIQDEDGLAHFKSISLPQNFDITNQNNPSYKQGRFSKRLIPFINGYNISYFAARIIRNKIITEIPVKVSTIKQYWIKYDGERIYDYEYIFGFDDLEVGDILEYTYKAEIKESYDTDQFYVNDFFPKLNTILTVKIAASGSLYKSDMVMNHNIDSTLFTKTIIPGKNFSTQNYVYKFKKLKAIKYSQNVLAGKTLAHVTANIYNVNKHYVENTLVSSKYLYTTKFSWSIIPDSLNEKEKVYDKYGANLRKFISKFPDDKNDSSKTHFVSQYVDTINTYKFVSSEYMHYSGEAQYSLSSSERLLKRELIEEYIGKTYYDILFEKNVFYYIANIQDRRRGIHTKRNRSHENYEFEFFALPVKSSLKIFIPRFNGIKYLPDELPYYFEGSLCALFPKNTKAANYKEGSQTIKFFKTHTSSFNENVRTENAMFKINLDSSTIHANIKTNLNGQFSTILRHYYNNDIIDSTIKVEYFKKSVDKPNASNKYIKLISQAKTFPFKCSYDCSENIKISKNFIDLTNWFSFIHNKENFKELLTQNYYLDFAFTDNYNFLFEFNKPTEVTNTEEFNKKLSNNFFEISTTLNKQEENKYLLIVSVKTKQYILQEEKIGYLTEYLNLLAQINSLKLKYTN